MTQKVLPRIVGKFSFVKHEYDNKTIINARIEGKVMALNEILRIDEPYLHHNLLYKVRDGKTRYYVTIYDYYKIICEDQ